MTPEIGISVCSADHIHRNTCRDGAAINSTLSLSQSTPHVLSYGLDPHDGLCRPAGRSSWHGLRAASASIANTAACTQWPGLTKRHEPNIENIRTLEHGRNAEGDGGRIRTHIAPHGHGKVAGARCCCHGVLRCSAGIDCAIRPCPCICVCVLTTSCVCVFCICVCVCVCVCAPAPVCMLFGSPDCEIIVHHLERTRSCVCDHALLLPSVPRRPQTPETVFSSPTPRSSRTPSLPNSLPP
jgi:hypothetical protein